RGERDARRRRPRVGRRGHRPPDRLARPARRRGGHRGGPAPLLRRRGGPRRSGARLDRRHRPGQDRRGRRALARRPVGAAPRRRVGGHRRTVPSGGFGDFVRPRGRSGTIGPMQRARLVGADRIRIPARPHPPWPGIEHQLSRSRLFIRHTPATSADAEPALFVHGLGGSAQNWTDLADALSDHVAADAVDLPGFGHSAPSRRATIPSLAQDVAAWIVESGRGPVHLAGHSLGGAVSVYLAATRPHLVRTLTLVSPAMPFGNPRRSHQSRFLPMLIVPRMAQIADRALRSRTPQQVVDDIFLGTWADPSRIHPQRRREAIAEARRRLAVPWHSSTYIRTYRGLMASFFQSFVPGTHSLWRLARQIQAP